MPNIGFRSRRTAQDLKDFIEKHRFEAQPTGLILPDRPPATEKIIAVKNTAATTCPQGGLLRIISEGPHPDDSRIYVITCGKPNDEFQLEYLVAVWAEIPADKYGYASELIHADWVRRAGANSTHRRWGATNDEWGLTAGLPGFVGMGTSPKEVSGLTYIRVKQQVVPVIIGRANGEIEAEATDGSVNVMFGPTYVTGNGQTVESCYNPAFTIADQALVSVAWPNGYPVVAALTCPPEA